jgi:hypothetical protein
MIIDILNSTFCKIDLFKNYFTNVFKTDRDNILGAYYFNGTDINLLIPNDNECSFSYWRQDGDYSVKKQDTLVCDLSNLITGKFIFVYFSRSKKDESTIFRNVNKYLNEISDNDSNINFEIRKINTNKLDTVKLEHKYNKVLSDYLLFSDSTYMNIQVDISYLFDEDCKEIECT